jgi:uncharacterized protein DUF6484
MNTKQTDVLEIEAIERSALDDLLAADARPGRSSDAASSSRIGILAGFTDSGVPLVNVAGQVESLLARHTCTITSADAGREVVLVFEDGDLRKPIILGLLQAPVPLGADSGLQPLNASVDGEQVTVSAKNEIVLRCGKASITLTRAGKIIIRGAYVLSRSSGVNRIKGGSVQIN